MRANSQFGEGVVLGTPGARGVGYLVILQKGGQNLIGHELQGNMREICNGLEEITKFDPFTWAPE